MNSDIKNLNYDTQILLPELLEIAPGIKEPYYQLVKQFGQLSKADELELLEISQLHNLPVQKGNNPGMTIVFENLLTPYLVNLVEENHDMDQAIKIMKWIEKLTTNEQFAIRNLVAGSFCIPLVTSYEKYFAKIFPYMGKQTIAMCRLATTGYAISQSTKNLLAK